MYHADDIASVVLARSGPWTDAMSLQKLLYYAQAWHLAVTDQPLFSEKIKAWKDGPVVPQVWHARKDQATRRAAAQDTDTIILDDLSKEIIELVIAAYGSMSGDELSALTHVEEPWKEARGDLSDDAECRNPISTDTMAKFYRANRRLGGRSAADLAAGGVFRRSRDTQGLVDVRALLAEIGDSECQTHDEWGGANLTPARGHSRRSATRSYAGT